MESRSATGCAAGPPIRRSCRLAGMPRARAVEAASDVRPRSPCQEPTAQLVYQRHHIEAFDAIARNEPGKRRRICAVRHMFQPS